MNTFVNISRNYYLYTDFIIVSINIKRLYLRVSVLADKNANKILKTLKSSHKMKYKANKMKNKNFQNI
jgi:hypothetical protein